MGVIAESEWRGGEQKKLEFCKVDMPTITIISTASIYFYFYFYFYLHFYSYRGLHGSNGYKLP